MKKRFLLISVLLLMIIGCMCGCGKEKRTCPMCHQKYNVDEGVEFGPYMICPNCDRDNQFIEEFMGSTQE